MARKRVVKLKRRLVDLLTFSPFFTDNNFALIRRVLAAQAAISFFIAFCTWHIMFGATVYAPTSGSVLRLEECFPQTWYHSLLNLGMWNLLLMVLRMGGCAYMVLSDHQWAQSESLRAFMQVVEQLLLPSMVSTGVFFWGSVVRRTKLVGIAFTALTYFNSINIFLFQPLVYIVEIWLGKIPLAAVNCWMMLLYVGFHIAVVALYSIGTGGCWLIPTLDPRHTIPFLAFPGHIFTYVFGFVACFVYYQVRDHGSVLGQVALPPKKYTTALAPHLEREKRQQKITALAETKAATKASQVEDTKKAKEQKNKTDSSDVIASYNTPGAAAAYGGATPNISAIEFLAASPVPDERFPLRKTATQPELTVRWTSSKVGGGGGSGYTSGGGSARITHKRRSLSSLMTSNAVMPHGDVTSTKAYTRTFTPLPEQKGYIPPKGGIGPFSAEEAIQHMLKSGMNVRKTSVRRLPKIGPEGSASSSKLRSSLSNSTSSLGSMKSLKQVHVAETPDKLSAWLEEDNDEQVKFETLTTDSKNNLARRTSDDSVIDRLLFDVNNDDDDDDDDDAGIAKKYAHAQVVVSSYSANNNATRVKTNGTVEPNNAKQNDDGDDDDDDDESEEDDVLKNWMAAPPGFIDEDLDDDDNDPARSNTKPFL